MSPSTAALAVGSGLCVAVFGTVTAGHFARPDGTPAGMRLILTASGLGLALMETMLVMRGAGHGWPAALVGEALATGLFGWTVASTRGSGLRLAFDDARPTCLIVRGPYAWIRHPFYSAYLLFWSSAAFGVADRRSLLVPLAMLALYARAAGCEERKFERSGLARAYRAYAVGTGRFLPQLSSLAVQDPRDRLRVPTIPDQF